AVRHWTVPGNLPMRWSTARPPKGIVEKRAPKVAMHRGCFGTAGEWTQDRQSEFCRDLAPKRPTPTALQNKAQGQRRSRATLGRRPPLFPENSEGVPQVGRCREAEGLTTEVTEGTEKKGRGWINLGGGV